MGSIQYNPTSDDEILIIQCGSGSFHPFSKPLAGTPIPDGCNNEVLEDSFSINEDPHNDNYWLYKMKIDKSSATELMSASQCRAIVGK